METIKNDFIITAAANGWIAGRKPQVFKGRPHLAGTNDVKVVYDDNNGLGYTEDDALRALEQLAADDDTVYIDEQVLKEYYEGDAPDWYNGEGYYNELEGHLIYTPGKNRYETDSVIFTVERFF